MFLKYVQTLLEQGTGTLQILQNSLPWPLNYFSSILLIFIVGYFIKLTFKYILNPASLSHMWHRNSQHHPYVNQTAALSQGDANTDRISGENLKALLNVIHATTVSNKQPVVPAVSGVQEVHEAIESAPANDTSTSSVSSPDVTVNATSKVKKNNNNSPKEQKADVTVEDLPDDDT